MIMQVCRDDFRAAFRAVRPEQFSGSALDALFDWFEDWEDSTGETITLDVIGVCCDWWELSPDELAREYSHFVYEDDEDWLACLLARLADETDVIPVSRFGLGFALAYLVRAY